MCVVAVERGGRGERERRERETGEVKGEEAAKLGWVITHLKYIKRAKVLISK